MWWEGERGTGQGANWGPFIGYIHPFILWRGQPAGKHQHSTTVYEYSAYAPSYINEHIPLVGTMHVSRILWQSLCLSNMDQTTTALYHRRIFRKP